MFFQKVPSNNIRLELTSAEETSNSIKHFLLIGGSLPSHGIAFDILV